MPLPRIHLAIKRLDIDGTLVGMNIEDAWCATFLMSFKQRLPGTKSIRTNVRASGSSGFR